MNIEDTTGQPIEANPFVNEGFTFRVRVLTDKKEYVNAGTLLSPIMVHPEIVLEGEAHTKLFRSAAWCKIKMNMTPCAYKLCTWIEMKIERNEDYIAINKALFLTQTELSDKSYNRAIKELRHVSFISPSTIPGTYFINPGIMFFGNRVAKYPSHIKR